MRETLVRTRKRKHSENMAVDLYGSLWADVAHDEGSNRRVVMKTMVREKETANGRMWRKERELNSGYCNICFTVSTTSSEVY